MRTQRGIVLVTVLAVSLPTGAVVRLPAVIGSNMVLQQGVPVPIWGWAEPGEKVTVAFAGQTKTARADEAGNWCVKLDALASGVSGRMTVAGGPSAGRGARAPALTVENVLVGEVWICSGQSNMQWAVAGADNAKAEIAAAKYPRMRLFTVPRRAVAKRQSDCAGRWVLCSPKTISGFSAVGYYFGRHVHKNLKRPVGLINTSWGGTLIEPWTSREAMLAVPEFKAIVDRWDADVAKKQAANGKIRGKAKSGRRGQKANSHSRPGNLFNGMIAPLVPLAVRGAIWYQGESNVGRAEQYRRLFPNMIRDWRRQWGQDEFTFLWVQLANFRAREPQPGQSAWAELQEAQAMTLSVPRTGMAVINDIGAAKDIHPRNKQDVGRRLGLAARAVAYGERIVYSGPAYESMKIGGSKVRIKFKHTGGGLVAKGGKLKGFALAAADRKFVWAGAKIEGDTVVVSSAKVAKPAAVRYAWASNPDCNLYNAEGLPASLFRTDDWPGITAGKK